MFYVRREFVFEGCVATCDIGVAVSKKVEPQLLL